VKERARERGGRERERGGGRGGREKFSHFLG